MQLGRSSLKPVPYFFLGPADSGLWFHRHGEAWNALVHGAKTALLLTVSLPFLKDDGFLANTGRYRDTCMSRECDPRKVGRFRSQVKSGGCFTHRVI